MQLRRSTTNEDGEEVDDADGFQMVAGSGDVGGISALSPQVQRVLHALQVKG